MQYAFSFYRDLKEHLFFCVRPDAETSTLIDQRKRHLLRASHLSGRSRDRKLLHITLHGAGEYEDLPAHVVAAARRIGDAVSMPPFEVMLHSIKSFPQPRRNKPLVLLAESDGLRELHNRLAILMRKNGFRVDGRFTPHMTLHYGTQSIPSRTIEPICFTVEEFVFVHSEFGRSRHNVIGRWPLRIDNGGQAGDAPLE